MLKKWRGERVLPSSHLSSTTAFLQILAKVQLGAREVMPHFDYFNQKRQYFTFNSPIIISTLKCCHCLFIKNGFWSYWNNVTDIKSGMWTKIYAIQATMMVGGTLNSNCHTYCLQSCSLSHIFTFCICPKGPDMQFGFQQHDNVNLNSLIKKNVKEKNCFASFLGHLSSLAHSSCLVSLPKYTRCQILFGALKKIMGYTLKVVGEHLKGDVFSPQVSTSWPSGNGKGVSQ